MQELNVYFSEEFSRRDGKVKGYRLQGSLVDIKIMYYIATFDDLSIDTPTYIANLKYKNGNMTIEVFQSIDGLWHARIENWEWISIERDEAVLNLWLNYYLIENLHPDIKW